MSQRQNVRDSGSIDLQPFHNATASDSRSFPAIERLLLPASDNLSYPSGRSRALLLTGFLLHPVSVPWVQ